MTRPLPPLSSFQRNNLPQDWAAVEADLARFQERFPELALLAVLHQPAAYSDALLAELQACASEPQKRTDDAEGWMLHLYAMHLMATLRDTRAFTPLLGIARLDGETLENLLGDHLTEGLPRALAATCPGNEAALQAMASDRGAYFWSRSAALRALALRTLEGDYPRADLLAWLQTESEREAERMVDDKLQPEQGTETDYLSELVVTMEEIGASEMAPRVAEWFEDGLIDDAFLEPAESQKRLERDWASCQQDELAHGWGYPRDIVAEIGRWACFQPDEDDEDELEDAPKHPPIVRESPKVGRNDPCPCGSGKKYKKCCGQD
ncbi:hypothetical protein GCM10027296_33890 [Chitinimonas naiadis]